MRFCSLHVKAGRKRTPKTSQRQQKQKKLLRKETSTLDLLPTEDFGGYTFKILVYDNMDEEHLAENTNAEPLYVYNFSNMGFFFMDCLTSKRAEFVSLYQKREKATIKRIENFWESIDF